MDFPVSPVNRLPIFPDEAASAAALLELIGASGGGDHESGNASRGAVVAGFGHRSCEEQLAGGGYNEEKTVAGGGAALSGFSESEGDNAEALDQVEGGVHFDGGQEAVIQDRSESCERGSAQSTGKVDPQAPGWTKRVRVGNQPPDRAPCPERIGALEQTIRGYADKLGDHVVEPAIGLTFDSLGEAYDFYNLYSWEHGFGIRYGKSRLNAEKTKCMQKVVCGCSLYRRAMFEKFGEVLYQAHAYQVEELEKNKLYRATHTQAEWREKWSRIVHEVKILDQQENTMNFLDLLSY